MQRKMDFKDYLNYLTFITTWVHGVFFVAGCIFAYFGIKRSLEYDFFAAIYFFVFATVMIRFSITEPLVVLFADSTVADGYIAQTRKNVKTSKKETSISFEAIVKSEDGTYTSEWMQCKKKLIGQDNLPVKLVIINDKVYTFYVE